MKILRIVEQCRRDFTAVYICEHCGYEEEGRGYDDANFHNNVIPTFVCKSCGKIAGGDYAPWPTRYPEGMQV